MDFKSAVTRARRGLREERRLYLVAVSSLTVAFLCVAGAILTMQNLAEMADRWGRSGRVTVYLRDGAQNEDVQRLRAVLEGLSETAAVTHLSSAEARAQFLEHADVGADLSALPAEAFPASLEVTLVADAEPERVDAIAARVTEFRAVQDVETYRGWFDRLESLLAAGRGFAFALTLLVSLCVVAVIGNTIRLAVARRRQEIEVMKLCGATDGFVRGPFVLEGTFQGFISAFLAVAILMLGFFLLRPRIDVTFAALAGMRSVFIEPWLLVALIVTGAAVGALGSAISLRRYLTV